MIMKRFTTTLSALFVACMAMVATAKAEIKVASVNMTELNIMFYERVEVEASLKKQEADIQQEVNSRQEKVRALAEELKQLQSQVDPTLTNAALDTLRSKAASIKNEYDAALQELQTFVQRRQAAFREIVRRELALLAQKLHAAVESVAAEAGYDVVLDASAVSQQPGARVFPYVKPALDISPAVLTRLNAGAPADFDPQAELQRVRNAVPAAPAAQ